MNPKVNVKEIQLTLITFKDDNVYNVYCPSLNLCGSGYNETEAKDSFNIVFNEYITYTTENNTLIDDLKSCGWKISENSKKLLPPAIAESLLLDKDLGAILNNYDFEKRSIKATIPIA